MRTVILGSFLLVALCSFGCGGPQGPELKKNDLVSELEIPTRANPEGRLPVICVKPFTLTRGISDPHVVGEARVGAYPVAVQSEDSVDMIVMNHLKQGLIKAGFRLGDAGECDFEISGRIERFWVGERYPVQRARASVRYDLIVRDQNGRFLWGDTIEGRDSAWDQGDVTKHDVPTLVKALNKSVESIFGNWAFWETVRK